MSVHGRMESDPQILTWDGFSKVRLPSFVLVVLLQGLSDTVLEHRSRRAMCIGWCSIIMTLLCTVFPVRRVARQVFLGKDECIRRISVRNLQVVFLWHGVNFGYVSC